MNHRFALSLKTDTAGRWLWGFADGTDVLTGTSTARSRDDAVLCALAASHDDLTAGGPVEVVLSLHESSGIWGLTAELATHFAGVALVPFTDADADIRAAAQATLRPAASGPVVAKQHVPLGPVTVATDGSAARGSIGWGWLASDGTHACASAKPSVRECGRGSLALLAELRAISAAIDALPSQHLTILTDCVPALALIRGWIEGADRLPVGYVATHHTASKKGGLIWMQEQVRREAHRIEFGWVRGHVGDSLNEGADSLAKLARRATEGTWGFTPADVPTRAQSIAEVFATDHRRLATAA